MKRVDVVDCLEQLGLMVISYPAEDTIGSSISRPRPVSVGRRNSNTSIHGTTLYAVQNGKLTTDPAVDYDWCHMHKQYGWKILTDLFELQEWAIDYFDL